MDTSTSLRPLLASDLPTVTTWLREFITEHRTWWTDAYGAEPGTPLEDVVASEREELVANAERDDHLVRVRQATPVPHGAQSGRPQGIVYANAHRDRYMGFTIGVLAWIYVDPSARGRGVAADLMRAAEAWFVERGAMGRAVYVTAANERAVGLYRRHGYRIVDHRMLKRG